MLDHNFLDAIGAVRRSLEDALLERHAFEERFQIDVLLGDATWVTSYTLPGVGMVARVSVEIDLDWPTWSQTAWRSLSIGEDVDDPPQVLVQLTLRLARLASRPDAGAVLAVLPDAGPELTGEALERGHAVVEEHLQPDQPSFAVEVPYEGVYDIDPEAAEKGTALDGLAVLGPWIASRLVSLADLDLPYLPPDPEDEERR
jgi:hypothetical protein